MNLTAKNILVLVLFIGLINGCSTAIQMDTSYQEIARVYTSHFELKCRSIDDLYTGDSTAVLFSPHTYPMIKKMYGVRSYKNKLGPYRIYLVFPARSHAEPYVVGIDSNLNLKMIAGFGQREAYSSPEINQSYNDTIYFPIEHWKSSSETKTFMTEYIKLVGIGVNPKFVDVDSMIITKSNDIIFGNCFSKIKYSKNEGIKQYWSFSIHSNGEILNRETARIPVKF